MKVSWQEDNKTSRNVHCFFSSSTIHPPACLHNLLHTIHSGSIEGRWGSQWRSHSVYYYPLAFLARRMNLQDEKPKDRHLLSQNLCKCIWVLKSKLYLPHELWFQISHVLICQQSLIMTHTFEDRICIFFSRNIKCCEYFFMSQYIKTNVMVVLSGSGDSRHPPCCDPSDPQQTSTVAHEKKTRIDCPQGPLGYL